MTKTRIAFYVSTGLFSVMMVGGAATYFAQYEMVSETFTQLGYPTYIIYPLAVAKILGLLAVWTRRSELLKDLAYAGFFYELILAASAHIAAGDGGFFAALIALALVITSFISQRSAGFEGAQTSTSSAPTGALSVGSA